MYLILNSESIGDSFREQLFEDVPLQFVPRCFLLCEKSLIFVLVNRNDINEVNYPNKQSETQSSNEIRQELKSRTYSQSNSKEGNYRLLHLTLTIIRSFKLTILKGLRVSVVFEAVVVVGASSICILLTNVTSQNKNKPI